MVNINVGSNECRGGRRKPSKKKEQKKRREKERKVVSVALNKL